MKENNKIFIINAAGAAQLERVIEGKVSRISIDDLFNKDENYNHSIVFLPNHPDYPQRIKEILLINPGIVFILYYVDDIKPSILVNFVQSGVTESVPVDSPKMINELIERCGEESQESKLNYFNNLIAKFRDIGIITNSTKMAEIFGGVLKVANSNSTVLIYGENGTGKELVAKSIHYFSVRRSYKFVGVNTGAIPENLLEDELFGHVKGSFTSAMKDRKGKFEYADKGTIFLDEISNMPPMLQVKLLRVLQEREFERVGDNENIKINVRVIAATNQRIKDLVDKGEFREDLYYRLNVIPIELPALRERKPDIPLLTNYFLMKYCRINNLPAKRMTLPAIRILQAYSWPGNIRQLENIIERMVVMNPESSIFMPGDVPEEVKPDLPEEKNSTFIPDEIPDEGFSLTEAVRNVERKLILKSLEKTSWNKQKAAELLKVKRTTLIEKIKKIQQ
ncbi:MAG: sigma-54-dependent Fis family transcriptional regulator [bacterium]|nr:sigma-54-dependent Fis family transcriptional regulator [bacterium]